jgi:capsid protein
MVAKVLTAVVREGDLLCVFDDGIIEGGGKVLWFEADQICDCENLPAPWNDAKRFTMESGVIVDKWGRPQAYICTRTRGQISVPYEKCTIFPADKCRLVKSTWRVNMLRGSAQLLTSSADLQDGYELREKEKQTAKLGASLAGVVTSQSGLPPIDMTNPGNQSDGSTAGVPSAVNYNRLESFTGGILEYLEPGDKFEPISFDRPTVNFRDALDWNARTACAALNLTKTYSTLSTEASYTAFRGDMLLAWAGFEVWQKFLERHVCDWLASKAIAWAVATKKLQPPQSDFSMSWDWPKMPAIDPLKEASAKAMNLTNLLADYAEILGPDWRKKLSALAEQSAFAKSLGLPLMIFENPKDGLRFTNQPIVNGE